MGREYEEERLFSENLDRLLAGEEIPTGAAMGSDLLSALGFARKMQDLRVTPSPRFQTSLKARLLQKLNEREAEARPGWFWKIIPREPVWQAIAVLAIMVVVGGVLWSTLFQPTPPSVVSVPTPPAVSTVPPATTAAAPTAAPAPAPSSPAAPATQPASTPAPVNKYLAAEASTDKPSYQPGETVSIHMVWQNVSSGNLTINEFPPILSLMQKSSGQPVYTFAAGTNSLTLAPRQKADYTLTWDQLDSRGRRAAPGSYYLELEEMYYQGQAVPLNLARPVDFVILPSSTGAWKTLPLDQSLTASGITVTLQEIQLSDNGARITAFVTPPPDYILKQGAGTLTPTQSYLASAGYSLDGGWVRDVGVSAVEYFGRGMSHTWSITDPLPPGAAELTFIINNIGGWAGPWQFDISL